MTHEREAEIRRLLAQSQEAAENCRSELRAWRERGGPEPETCFAARRVEEVASRAWVSGIAVAGPDLLAALDEARMVAAGCASKASDYERARDRNAEIGAEWRARAEQAERERDEARETARTEADAHDAWQRRAEQAEAQLRAAIASTPADLAASYRARIRVEVLREVTATLSSERRTGNDK